MKEEKLTAAELHYEQMLVSLLRLIREMTNLQAKEKDQATYKKDIDQLVRLIDTSWSQLKKDFPL
jgi:glucosamine 6-phosphate synthetase-like amidotransferase/phosphosugar isomerase protein